MGSGVIMWSSSGAAPRWTIKECVMRVLLISANRTDVNMRTIPLGLGCVASAVINAGHQVRLLDLMRVKKISRSLRPAIDEFKPEVIGVSLRNIDDQNMRSPREFLGEAKEIITEVKRLSSAPIVLGGAGYSMFPESVLSATLAHMGIQGEGEEAFPLLLERLQQNAPLSGVPGLYVRNAGLQGPRRYVSDLDRLPLPDSHLLTMDAEMVPVQTRRGCPFGCSYCSTGLIEGTRLRKRSPETVVKWISSLAEKGVTQLYFVDNTFNLPASYAMELCRKLQRASLRLTWWCILYPFRVDESLVSAMADAGCVEASMGFESGCERILSAMGKRFTQKDIIRTNHLLRAHGIRRMGFLLFGAPGETRESVEESLEFADSLELDALKITIGIRIYPGTPLAEQAKNEGIITREADLLSPRFYMMPGLEEWLRDRVADYARHRPHCMLDT